MLADGGDGVAGGCGDACVASSTIGAAIHPTNAFSALCVRSVDPHASAQQGS